MSSDPTTTSSAHSHSHSQSLAPASTHSGPQPKVQPQDSDPSAWPGAAMAALLGTVLTCLLTYPGWSSADSLAQYLQTTGALRLDDVHPPLMAALWRLTDAVVEGSGGLYLLFVTAWWSGLAATTWQLFPRTWQRWFATLVVGFWPAAFLTLAHVWKDVGMVASLLIAVAAILRWHGGGGRGSFVVALSALVCACGFRHNGLFAAWPLLAWLCWPRAGAARNRWTRTGALAVLTLVLVIAPMLIARLTGAARGDAWTVVALWDVGAMSIAQDRMLMPPELAMPDLTVDELRAGYLPYANPPIFGSGKIVLSLFVPYTDAQRAAVRRAWRDGVRTSPEAYVAHRWAMAKFLLFGYDTSVPFQLVYVPERLVVGEPATLAPLPGDDALARVARLLWTTPLFAGVVYLGLAGLALLGAMRPSRRGTRLAVVAIAVSAFANALPLAVISGSAEFRYLAWTVLAALLAAAAAWCPRPPRAQP